MMAWVTVANDCARARSLVDDPELDIDVALLDYWLPDGTGMELVPRVRRRWPDVRVTIYTGGPLDTEMVNRAYAAGARLVHKPSGVGAASLLQLREDTVPCRTRCPLRGSCAFAPTPDPLLDYPACLYLVATTRAYGFAEKEASVMRLTVARQTRSACARQLGITENTIKTHAARMRDKSGLPPGELAQCIRDAVVRGDRALLPHRVREALVPR